MSPKHLGSLQAPFCELCLVLGCLGAVLWSWELLFVLPCCLGRGLPDGPLLSLAQGRCSGKAVPQSCPGAASARERGAGSNWDPAEAAASVLPAINFCRCAFCSFPVLTPLPQPGAFISNGSLETRWLFSFEVKSWKLTYF